MNSIPAIPFHVIPSRLRCTPLIVRLLAGALAVSGVQGCDSNTDGPSGIGTAVAVVDDTRLRRYVEALSAIGPRPARDALATQRTLAFLDATLRDLGYQPVAEPVANDPALHNLIVQRGDVANGSGVLEIGAHYDTVDRTPGADDNASGVAGLLEIARVFSGWHPDRPVRLLFFAAEEANLAGSRAHVANLTARNERVAGAMVLEMIGYATDRPATQTSPVRVPVLFWPPTRGNFIAVIGDFPSGRLGNRFESAAGRYVPELPFYSVNRLGGLFKDANRSDHKPYWDAGMPAVLLTDTANFRNPNYHAPGDVPATLNYAFLEQVTRAVAATALHWAGGGP